MSGAYRYIPLVRRTPQTWAILAVLLIGIGGCGYGYHEYGKYYERYEILVGHYLVEGIALDDWRRVEPRGDRIYLGPGARFAMRTEDYTQFLAQFELEILSGTGLDIIVRDVADRGAERTGITFEYAIDGCRAVLPDGREIPLEYNAETGGQTIRLLSEADLLEFWVDCERLFQGTTDAEATEFVILEVHDDTEILLGAVNYFDIDEI